MDRRCTKLIVHQAARQPCADRINSSSLRKYATHTNLDRPCASRGAGERSATPTPRCASVFSAQKSLVDRCILQTDSPDPFPQYRTDRNRSPLSNSGADRNGWCSDFSVVRILAHVCLPNGRIITFIIDYATTLSSHTHPTFAHANRAPESWTAQALGSRLPCPTMSSPELILLHGPVWDMLPNPGGYDQSCADPEWRRA